MKEIERDRERSEEREIERGGEDSYLHIVVSALVGSSDDN